QHHQPGRDAGVSAGGQRVRSAGEIDVHLFRAGDGGGEGRDDDVPARERHRVGAAAAGDGNDVIVGPAVERNSGRRDGIARAQIDDELIIPAQAADVQRRRGGVIVVQDGDAVADDVEERPVADDAHHVVFVDGVLIAVDVE